MHFFLLTAALAFVFSPTGSGQMAMTQADGCGPISGTIRVADDDVDLDEEDGYLVYEVSLWRDDDKFDVTIDAGSGEILCAERD